MTVRACVCDLPEDITSLPVTAQTFKLKTGRDPASTWENDGVHTVWVAVPADLQPYCQRQHELTAEAVWGIKVVIPQSLQTSIMEELHVHAAST